MKLIIAEGKEMRMPYLSTLCVRKSKPKLTKAFNFFFSKDW